MKRILLVEDDKYLIKLYSSKLAQEGFEIDLAITVDEAMHKVMHKKPDAILLDLILPGKDGFQFLEELKKFENGNVTTPVIILSNLGQDIDKKRTAELGAQDYLIKSNVSLSDIVNTVRRITSNK